MDKFAVITFYLYCI